MEALAPAAWGFALVFFRAAGLVVSAPLLGLRNAPAQTRVGLAAAVAFVACAGAGFPRAAPPPHLGALAAQVLLETALGLSAGAALRFTLEAAAAVGQLTSQAMGLGYGAMLDPIFGAESTVLSQLGGLLALSAAVALGLHRESIAWLAASLAEVPPGTVAGVADLARGAVVHALDAVVLAVRLGFPFLAAVTLGHLVLGLLGRAAQQLNFSNVGFSVSILFGGGALWLLLPPMARLCAQAALAALPRS